MNYFFILINVALIALGTYTATVTDLSTGVLVSITLPYLLIGILIGAALSENEKNMYKRLFKRNK